MRSVGIDVGARYTKVVVIEDGNVIGRAKVITGFDIVKAAKDALGAAFEGAGIRESDVDVMVATGMGREGIKGAIAGIKKTYSEITCVAKGAVHLIPTARTVIDIGAEDCRAIKCDEKGVVQDFATNDKCAAGTGTFLETLAKILQVDVAELSDLSLKSTQTIPINAQCTVFAESEVVSLIHHFKAKKEDIARAVLEALASRISGIVQRVGVEKDVVVVGGPANSTALVKLLGEDLGVDLKTPENPEYVCALGAALFGLEG